MELIEGQHFTEPPTFAILARCGASMRRVQPQRSRDMSSKLSFAMAALALGAAFTSTTAAMAADCPAGKIVADGKGQPMGATEPKDVTDMVLASIDLAKENVAADG